MSSTGAPVTTTPDNVIEASIDAQELRRVASIRSPSCSQPLGNDHKLCTGSNSIEVETVPAEYMERLILLTLKARSGHAPDDETVDLTEPRFESFCMANVKSP